jgi:hypothetical protein
MIKEVQGTKEKHLVKWHEDKQIFSCTCHHGSMFPNAYTEWLNMTELSEKIGLCKHIREFMRELNERKV